MQTKPIVRSRTFWLNVLALIVAVVQSKYGTLPAVDPETFVGALGVTNIALRFLTNRGVTVLPQAPESEP